MGPQAARAATSTLLSGARPGPRPGPAHSEITTQPGAPQPARPIGGDQASRGEKPEFLASWLSLSSPSALFGLSFHFCE